MPTIFLRLCVEFHLSGTIQRSSQSQDNHQACGVTAPVYPNHRDSGRGNDHTPCTLRYATSSRATPVSEIAGKAYDAATGSYVLPWEWVYWRDREGNIRKRGKNYWPVPVDRSHDISLLNQ